MACINPIKIKHFCDSENPQSLKKSSQSYLQVLKAYIELISGVIMINVHMNILGKRSKYENGELPHLSKSHFGKSQVAKAISPTGSGV